jgi:hypothetical protein
VSKALAFIVCALMVVVGAVGAFYFVVDLVEWLGN